MSNKIKLGFVGGGNDSLIGVLHKVAAVMFDRYHLVGGVFSSNKEVNVKTANDLPALLMDTLAGHIGPSAQDCILQDFVRGRRTEIETINGFIVEKAQAAGIEAPYNQAIIKMGQKIKQKELDLGLDNVEHLAALMSE